MYIYIDIYQPVHKSPLTAEENDCKQTMEAG